MRAIADCGLPMRAATSRWRRPALMRWAIKTLIRAACSQLALGIVRVARREGEARLPTSLCLTRTELQVEAMARGKMASAMMVPAICAPQYLRWRHSILIKRHQTTHSRQALPVNIVSAHFDLDVGRIGVRHWAIDAEL